MAKTNKKQTVRPVEEEDNSGIRTRKVRFTGDGFAFPTPEKQGAPNTGKGKNNGRDAIIVEGTPGQGNIKNRSENSITELPVPKNGKNGNVNKSRKKKTAGAEKPKEPLSEALAVLPAEKNTRPAKGKKKRSKLAERNPEAVTGRKNADKQIPEKQTAEKQVKNKHTAEKAAAVPKPETKSVPAEKTAGKPSTETAVTPDKNSRKKDTKSRKSSKKAVRNMPADHQKSQKKTMTDPVAASDPFVTCKFTYSGRGFGFAVPLESETGSGEDIFVSPKATMGAMTGDTVKVRLLRQTRSGHGPEGEVEEILERAVHRITGRLTIKPEYAVVVPDNYKLRVKIYVSLEECAAVGAAHGDKVEILPIVGEFFDRTQPVAISRSRKKVHDFDTQGRIAVIFGDAAGREANYAAILHASGIRTEFPPYVKTAAANAAGQSLSTAGRVDLRDKLIFTIDGADAKDLDDAISLDVLPNGDWVLGVHIADVSHYVPYEGCVEKEARARGTSVYFTDKVIPMLPEELSNGACSLNADTDKYALSCEITLSPDGRRKHTVLYKSLLQSRVRGVYSEINDLFEKENGSIYAEKYAAVAGVLANMRVLYGILREQAADRGVMELEGSEAKFVLDAEGYPIDVQRRDRGDGEKMIEQFMLQANMGVAETLRARELPCLYRIHEEPDREKLRAFAVYAHNLGLPTFGLTAMTYSADDKDEIDRENLSERLMGILAEAHKKGIGDIVSSVLLRSMMKAKYIAEPKPHFGLGAETYCHFTSPIRRYPDLFVHTVLSAVLPYTPEGKLDKDTVLPPEAFPQMLSMAAPERGVSSTDTEITAQQVERKMEDLYMALYMSDKVGQIFDVTVVSVVKFGLFVQCENLVEGLVPALLFRDAVVNEDFCTLRSEGALYTLGTKMQVRLVEADPASGRITFAPLNGVEG